MKLFLDTSAFAKRYVAEAGSDAVLVLCDQATSIGLSVLCLPELTSTLCRLVRERRLSKAKYGELHTVIVTDLADVDICDITPAVMKHTLVQLESGPLRTLDAIQLGCAIAYAPALFVSADTRQLAAARRAGLAVRAV
ncbi:MAG: type II toxin-antitoxin system VapC family toxin [Casimicrobiaceae bacterium]